MKIELRDIIDNKIAIAHTEAPPQNITLGTIFDQKDELKAIKPYVVQVKINGSKIENWQTTALLDSDHVEMDIAPGAVLAPIGAWIAANAVAIAQVVAVIATVISTIVQLVNRPKPVKMDAAKDSQTYSWDGIKTSYTPGGPVPVIYGEAAAGGQLINLD